MSFEKIILNEKKYSKIFLEKNLIERNFNIKEYQVIKILFEEKNLIEKLWNTINDICKHDTYEHKCLAFTDFLFAILPQNNNDNNEHFFIINRRTILQRLRLRADINIDFEMDKIKYMNTVKKIIIGLRIEKIIEKIVIKKVNNNIWGTEVFLKFLIKTNIEDIEHWGQAIEKFEIIKLNSLYSCSSFRNLWKLKRKKKEIESINIPTDSVERANKTGFILKSELVEFSKEIIKDEKKRLLNLAECKSYKEYWLKLKNLEKKININFNWYTDDFEFCEVIEEREKKQNKKIKDIFQKILSLSIFERARKDEIFYLPCFMDSRGRQYYGTLLSPTFYNIFRYHLEFEKKTFSGLKESIFYKKILSYKNEVEEYGLSEENSYYLIVLFIEIGKFFIKNDINEIKTTNTIIATGKKKYKEKELTNNFNDNLYLNKIFKNLDNFLKDKKLNLNTLIFKDATASGLQNFGILYKYKEEYLKYLNLDGDNYCDTYQFIINKYLENTSEKYWKRKYWKQTIMTIPYNAAWFTCFKYFLDALEKDGIIYSKMDEIEKKEIKKMHLNFYNKISNEIKKEFYINNTAEFKEFKYNTWKIVNIEEYKITYKKNRDKYTNILYMLTDDKSTTLRAAEANNMHYLDAKLVHFVTEEVRALTIHDCFAVSLGELHKIMDRVNWYYSSQINKFTYSIHVII